MHTARLFGRDHHSVGALAAVAEGPAAITLSRGGYPKQYDHTEPNEDSALFAHDARGTLVAVADGHHGAAGAQAVIAYLEAEWARRWTAGDDVTCSDQAWSHESRRALAGANHALLADAARRGLPPAPTTLALGLVRYAEQCVLWAGIGDSHVFAVDGHRATDLLNSPLADRRTAFLGYESLNDESLETRSAAGMLALSSVRALVLATDGLSEQGIGVADPADAVGLAARDCASIDGELRPLALARRISNVAMAAHREHAAGDNIASAVIWTGD